MATKHTAKRQSRPAPLRRRRRSDRTGAAVVEFAFVANILFITVFTCLEFSRINLLRNTCQNAAYYAARKGMVSGATAAEAKATATNLLNAVGANGVTITVNDGAELDSDTEDVEVKIQLNYHDNAFFAPLFIPNKNFIATAKMKAERYDFFYNGEN